MSICKTCGRRFYDDDSLYYCSDECWFNSDEYKEAEKVSVEFLKSLTKEQRDTLRYMLKHEWGWICVLDDKLKGMKK